MPRGMLTNRPDVNPLGVFCGPEQDLGRSVPPRCHVVGEDRVRDLRRGKSHGQSLHSTGGRTWWQRQAMVGQVKGGGVTCDELRDWIERARPKSQTLTRQSELRSMFEGFISLPRAEGFKSDQDEERKG